MPFTPMSPILVAGLTIAMRFIFAGCCARAASGHVAAVPPKSVMNSRRCMHPPEGKTHRRLKPNTLRRGGGEKGQPIDPRRCDPMSVRGQTEKNSARAHVFRFALELGHCSTQSACLKAISGDCRHLSTNLVVRERPCDCTIAPVLGSFSAIISSYFSKGQR